MYKAVFKAANELCRNYDITYIVDEDNGTYFIEAFIEGTDIFEKAALGNCGLDKAEETAMIFAEKSVRPIHIEDIISDLRF